MAVLLWCSRCRETLLITDANSFKDVILSAQVHGWSTEPGAWLCQRHQAGSEDRQDFGCDAGFDGEPA